MVHSPQHPPFLRTCCIFFPDNFFSEHTVVPPPPPLYKLRLAGRPLGVHRSGRHGGWFLLSEVPASSTQFLLRVGRVT